MKRAATIIVAISFTACVPSYLWPVCEYFIEHYYGIADNPPLEISEKNGHTAIKCNIIYNPNHNPGYQYFTDAYKRVAEELGDTGYEKVGYRAEAGIAGRGFYSAYPIISAITIMSDAAWDNEHPAGVSLADCFDISYVTFAEYIDSGYDIEKFNTISEWKTKPLSDLAPNDLRLIRATSHIYLVITDLPSADKNHKLTVQFGLHDGSMRESTIAIEFP